MRSQTDVVLHLKATGSIQQQLNHSKCKRYHTPWTWGGGGGGLGSASREILHSKCQHGKNLVWWRWEVVTKIKPVFGLMVSSCHIWKGVRVNQHICHRVRCYTPSASFLCKICCFLLKTVQAQWRQTGRRWYITTVEMTSYNINISDSSGNQWKKAFIWTTSLLKYHT